MSKFKEYLKLVKDGFPNIDKIAEGVLNQVKSRYGYLPLEDQEEIARRQLICSTCPLFSLNAQKDDSEYRKLMGVPFETDRKNEKFCGVCGCPMETRTSSLSSDCGLEYYNENNQNNKQELKWKKTR